MEKMGNQLSRYGAVAALLPKLAPAAKVFFVLNNASPTWFGDFLFEFPTDKDGVIRVFGTVAAAYAQTVSGRGDVILVMPGHTETIAAATTLTGNGVSILGLGEGNNRGTITFSTATGASYVVAGDNVTFDNLKFVGNIASQVVMFDFSGQKGGQIKNCDFTSGGATKAPLITVKTDASSVDMQFINNNVNFSTNTSNTPTECIRLVGADRFQIANCYFSGNFSTAIVNNITTLVNDVQIENSVFYNLNTVATGGIVMLASSTGFIGGCTCYSAAASNTNFFTTFISPANCLLDTNTVQNAVGVGGDVSAPAGSYFALTKTITSSTITTSAQDLSLVSVGGDLYIENAILETDGTGLAGATNFRLLKNSGNGLAAIVEETVANLGANKTVDSYTASVVKQRCTLASGSKFQFLGTASAGTGAGTVKITLILMRMTAGANVVKA